MTQEQKQLLLKDLCGRLRYGVKILYEGWDSDHGCGYETVETLIGIDDRFVYTMWSGERYEHSLSAASYKPYLRPMDSMTDEEEWEYYQTFEWEENGNGGHYPSSKTEKTFDWLNTHHFDYRGLIEKGLALETPNDMYKLE